MHLCGTSGGAGCYTGSSLGAAAAVGLTFTYNQLHHTVTLQCCVVPSMSWQTPVPSTAGMPRQQRHAAGLADAGCGGACVQLLIDMIFLPHS